MLNKQWIYTEWYCQKCGKQTVVEIPIEWEENAGHQHICFSCGFGFMSPNKDYMDLSDQEKSDVISAAQQGVQRVAECDCGTPDGVHADFCISNLRNR